VALIGAGALAVIGAPSALAGVQGEFKAFNDCPVGNPTTATCVVSETTSGEFKIGKKTVPVNKPVILQGGLAVHSSVLIPAEDGNTLSKTALTVPGGLVGLEVLPPLTEVTATAELAGTVEVNVVNANSGKGVAAVLPLKVKLDNPLLGATCFIGSDAEPVTPMLTTGTTNPPPPNSPISGSTGTLAVEGAGKIVSINNSSLVDNAFAVPGANGCDEPLSLVVDPAIGLVVGLPAAAGENTAILNGRLEAAGANNVRNERLLPELGRCVKAEGSGKVFHGHYVDSGCIEESPLNNGKFEWKSGPGAARTFTGTGAAATLETTGGAKVKCAASHTTGEYTGTKTATVGIAFTGCSLGTEACQSAGAAAGELSAHSLSAQLGFVNDKVVAEELHLVLGWDLAHEPSVIEAECGAAKTALKITGSVIGAISAADKMLAGYSLKFAASGASQSPESFEEGPRDTLSAQIGGGSAEAIGLKATSKITNAEKVEFKGETAE
jgi:hypothetical protein